MAARFFVRRNVPPVATGLLAAAVAFYPTPIHAESPESDSITRLRKPIYDDPTNPEPPQSSNPSSDSSHSNASESSPTPREPTPTDRLTVQIRHARLALHDVSARAETEFNNLLTQAFHLESSFTSTIRSLAPPPEANEPLLPGFVYILVATLSGSIITRNRGIFLRFSIPLAFGLAAGQATIPHTMHNVGDLIWTYEKKYPQLADAHLQARERIERFWETGKSHTQMSLGMLEQKVDEARKGMEDWVSKGK